MTTENEKTNVTEEQSGIWRKTLHKIDFFKGADRLPKIFRYTAISHDIETTVKEIIMAISIQCKVLLGNLEFMWKLR